MAADGTATALGVVGLLAAAGLMSRRGSATSLRRRTFPRGTIFFHGTASPVRFEEQGIEVMTNPAWFTRDVRVARMIAVDDADEDDRPPRVLVFRATAPIGPLVVLRTQEDVSRMLATARGHRLERAARKSRAMRYEDAPLGPYDLARLVCKLGLNGWVVPYNYASSSSLFSYGEEIVCRPPSAACDDILLRDLSGLVLDRVELVPEAYLRERGRL